MPLTAVSPRRSHPEPRWRHRRAVTAVDLDVHRWRAERGIILPIVAISMLVLLAFSAFAVDVGLTYNHRRQDQGSVDAAAISAAIELLNVPTDANAPELVFDEVVRLSHENSMTGMTLEAWRAEWLTCQDPGTGPGTEYPLTLTTAAGAIDCVAFDADPPRRLRVRLPDHEVPGVFAGVLGTQFASSAVAEVEIAAGPGFGNVLPFAVPSISADGEFSCLFGGQGEHIPDECLGPDTGQWGVLSSPRPTEGWCGVAGGASQPFAENVAMGGDHELAAYDPADGTMLDRCVDDGGVVPDEAANRLVRSTGVTPEQLRAGLFDGHFVDGHRGRLTRSPIQVLGGGADIYGVPRSSVDNTGLWFFVPRGGEPNAKPVGPDLDHDIPLMCHPDLFVAFAHREALDDALVALGLTGYESAAFDRDAVIAWIEENLVVADGAPPGGGPPGGGPGGGGPGGAGGGLDLATKEHMDVCFADYNSGRWLPAPAAASYSDPGVSYRTVLFDRLRDDGEGSGYWLEGSPRFAWVPEALDHEAWATCSGGITCQFDIKMFRPIYLNTVAGRHGQQWHAGQPVPTGATANGPWGVQSYTFNPNMVPAELLEAGPVDVRGPRAVTLIR
jgi:hypothetical protein